jgi:hypothetical protein
MNTRKRTPNRSPNRRDRRRRGGALVELALCMPLLMLIIVTTMFFGWAMMNQQHVKAAARYASWRHVYTSQYEPQYDANDPDNVSDPDHPYINYHFFRDEGSQIGIGGGSGPIDELEELADRAGQYSGDAGQLASELLIDRTYWHGFHRAKRAEVSSHFTSDVEAFQRYQGSIRSEHIRDGVEWRRHQAEVRRAIREQYLLPLHGALESVPAPGDGMARMIQGLYKHGW